MNKGIDRAIRQDRAEEWLTTRGFDDPTDYRTPQHAVRYANLAELRAALREADDHTFDRDTMKYWRSRIIGNLYGGRFLVTSDDPEDAGPRYTVRYVVRTEPGTSRPLSVETLGDFLQYDTVAQAQDAAREAASVLFGVGR